MHFCNKCGRELSHREKFCKHCGTRIEYLCSLPPFPPGPERRREPRKPSSVGKWIFIYLISTATVFVLSYFYYSSPDLQAWTQRKPDFRATQTNEGLVTPAASSTATTTLTLKSAYNQFTVTVQKTSGLYEDSRKVNVPGDPKRTAENYRSILRKSDVLLAQLSVPPGSPTEVTAVLVPLKESLSLLGKSSATMADYLEGKLSLSPPNPDWVAKSQEFSAQGQARLVEAQQALTTLRKKID